MPLLITGIAGVAGYNALTYFGRLYPGQVVGIRQQRNCRLDGPGIEACDAEDREALARLFRRWRFRGVLNCAGNCALKHCEMDPPLAWRTNVEGIRTLLEFILAQQVRLVHLSIDLVFSGTGSGNHVETDPTDPVTVYGHTMVASEEIVRLADPAACVLRISLPMGVSFNGHAGAIDWIQWRFIQQKPATLYFDEIRTPSYTDCMNRLFHEALARPLAGLYHAGGPRSLSLFEIAQIVNRVGGYDPDHLQGIPRQEAGPMPPRAGNVTMDSGRLSQALGYDPLDPWPHDGDLVPTDRKWHYERPAGQAYSPQRLAAVLYNNPLRGPGLGEAY